MGTNRSSPVAAPPPPVLTLTASTSGNTITVVGVGTGSGTPDTAQLGLGVTTLRPTVRDAVSAASTDEAHLLTALHGQGVQDKDIQTASIYISTQTNCCPQVLAGYNAATTLVVTVHHIANVTPLIEAAVDSVGNDLQINNINLYVADQGPMLKTARAAAMTDANTKAEDYARLSGHHVGGLIGVSEVVSYGSGFSCDACGKGAGGGGGIQVQPGVTSVTVTVAVTFELAV
jgi:uncharacterized protein YggE